MITSPDADIAEDEAVTTTGSYSATAPVSSGAWIMQLVAFRANTNGGPILTSITVTPVNSCDRGECAAAIYCHRNLQ